METDAQHKGGERYESITTVPVSGKMHLFHLDKDKYRQYKYKKNFTIKLEPNVSVTLFELIRKGRKVEDSVTEPTEGASRKLGICPRVVKLDAVGKYQRVNVHLFNKSASPVLIALKTPRPISANYTRLRLCKL